MIRLLFKESQCFFLIDRPLFLNKDDIYGPGNRRIKLHGLKISWIDGGGGGNLAQFGRIGLRNLCV